MAESSTVNPHRSPFYVARAPQRRCGELHGPKVRAGVVVITLSGPSGVQLVTVRFAASVAGNR
jgi:hypothetical protein